MLLKDFKKWTGPYLVDSWFDNDNHGNPVLVDENTCEILNTIFDKLRVLTNLAEYKDEEKYRFFFRLPKGTAEEWETIEELKEEDYEITNKEEYYALFNKCFHKKWYWFSAYFFTNTYAGNRYYFIRIKGQTLIYAYDGKGDSRGDKYKQSYSCFVKPIVSLAEYLVEEAKRPHHKEFIEKHLDYRLRDGEVPYKDYWKIYPKEKKEFLKNYKGIDVDSFIESYEQGLISLKGATRFKKLTANKYCSMFKIMSEAIGTKFDDKKTLQENFHWISDGRNHGLELIDGNSEQEFDEWFEKEHGHFDHTFEIHTEFGRIDLYVEKDKDGYYLLLNGNGRYSAFIIMKIYFALKEKGVFVYIYDPGYAIDVYRGNDLYIATSKERWCDNFPKTKIKEYIKVIKWDPIEISLPK